MELLRKVRDFILTPPDTKITHDEWRRELLIAMVKGGVLGAVFFAADKGTSAIIPKGIPETPESRRSVEVAEVKNKMPELDENELTERRVQTFMYAFATMTRKEVLLVDQNFNIIGGGPIPIKKEILDLDEQIKIQENLGYFMLANQLKIQRDQKFQSWINTVRKMLKEQYPTIECNLVPRRKDAEKPELMSIRPNLIGRENDEMYFTSVLKQALAPVSSQNSMARYEFVKAVFSDPRIPKGLAALITGIPAIESGYEDNMESSAGAVGPWQIIKELGKELGLVREPVFQWRGRGRRKERVLESDGFDNRNNFALATHAIFFHFNNVHRSFLKSANVQYIMATFNLNEEDFIYPCVINAYHAGRTRLHKMIAWFRKTYTPEKVREKLGNRPYGQDIYSLMSKEYVETGEDTRYFRRARDYYPQVMAMADLLEQAIVKKKNPEIDLPGTYEPPMKEVVDLVPLAQEDLKKSDGMETIMPLAAAAIAGTTVHGTIDRIRGKFTRRGFSLSVGLNTISAFGGMFLGNIRQRAPVPFAKPEETPVLPKKPGLRPEEIIYALSALQTKLIDEHVSLARAQLLSIKERQILRSRFSNPDLRKWAEQHGFRPIEDEASLDRLAPKLTTLEERGTRYRLRHVGIPNPRDDKPNNDMRYARVLPQVEKLLQDISDEVNQEAHKAGLPKKYRVRVIVTGAARTNEYQRKLADYNTNAAKWSSHTLLNSIDITWKRFDIIDTTSNQFIMLLKDGDLDKELKIATMLEAILSRVLIRMMDQGRIMARQESINQSALHIMTLSQ